jgi:hypothetical protein
MEEKNKKPLAKTLRAIFPLLIALLLMMAIARLFVMLIGGEREPGSPTSEATYFALQKESLRHTFTPLSAEEEALFREKLALTPSEEALFWPEFNLFANQYEQTAVAHRLWLELLAEPGTEITDADRFIKLYLTENKRHKYLIERYSTIFSDLLSPSRMPLVFLLHDQIRAGRNSGKP